MRKKLSLFSALGSLALVFVLMFTLNVSPAHATDGENNEAEQGNSRGGKRMENDKPLLRLNGEMRTGEGIKGEWRLSTEGRPELQGAKAAFLLELKKQREEGKQKIEALRREAKGKFEALKEGIKNEKDATKAKIEALRITMREKALVGFDSIADRLSLLEDRITSTIEKLSAKGIDTEEATDFVDDSNDKLSEAKSKITEVNTLLGTSVNELSAEDKAKLQTLKSEIQTLLQAAHESLKSAVTSLKAAVKAKIGEAKVKGEANAEIDTDDEAGGEEN